MKIPTEQETQVALFAKVCDVLLNKVQAMDFSTEDKATFKRILDRLMYDAMTSEGKVES